VSLCVVRFFIGISGGVIVPSQAWITQFFDKPIIGTVTACSGGWGDAGVGGEPSLVRDSTSALITRTS
jgi:nitrate/nitrite transporter NarK